MSQRTVLRPVALPTIDMSASSTASDATVLQGLSMVSYACSWTGASPVGTISLEISNDYSLYPDGTVNNAGIWNLVPLNVNGTFTTSCAVSGNTGNGYIDVSATAGYAVRLLYTRTSGSGTLTIVVSGKVA